MLHHFQWFLLDPGIEGVLFPVFFNNVLCGILRWIAAQRMHGITQILINPDKVNLELGRTFWMHILRFVLIKEDRFHFWVPRQHNRKNGEQDCSPFGQSLLERRSIFALHQSPFCPLPNRLRDSLFFITPMLEHSRVRFCFTLSLNYDRIIPKTNFLCLCMTL